MEQKTNTRGGWRNGGRPSIEGKERRWIIPQDILDIIDDKGKAYIWEAIRFKYALDRMQEKTKTD